MSIFTAAELDELRRADAEIDDDFSETPEERAMSAALDRAAKYDRMDNAASKIAAYQAAYYEANKDKIAARNAAYQAAYREANKDKYNAYMRNYMRKRSHRKEISHGE